MIRSFNDLLEIGRAGEKKVLSVAAAHNKGVLEAVKHARDEGLIEPILVGRKDEIEGIAGEIGLDLAGLEIVDEADDLQAATEATKLVSSGRADILMKGILGTATILSQVLNRDYGLRAGRPLSQAVLFEISSYHKMFIGTDFAFNIAPDLDTKKSIIDNAVGLAHAIGIDEPKVAVLAALEKVNPKMVATLDAQSLTRMNEAGEIKGCKVYGPLAMDNAVSKESARIKGIDSDVAGDADIFLAPDIEAGNILYKSLTFLGGAKSAGIVLGAKAPVIITSRADSSVDKFNSIVLATILANK